MYKNIPALHVRYVLVHVLSHNIMIVDEIYYPANAAGDSFLNRCFANNEFFQKISGFYTPLLGWSEPYPLIFLLLMLLIVLPTIFRVGAFLKVSRLYNITRLGLLSLFHQISYSYTVMESLCLIFKQPAPCFDNMISLSDVNNFSFPSTIISSSAFLIFTVTKYAGIKIYWAVLIWLAFFSVQTFLAIADNFNTFFQIVVTIFFSYLLHKWHTFLPFKFIHIENAVLLVFSLVIFIVYAVKKLSSFSNLFFTMWFNFLVLIIDEVLLARHHQTRGDFSTIERPGDLKWTIETEHVETIRLLNSEEEEMFTKNIDVDLNTSIIAFVIFFIGVLLRRLVTSENFFRTG